MHIWIINGPNLNLLGKRQTHIYGERSFEAFFEELKNAFEGVELHYFQSNSEGALIDQLHEVGFTADGIVFNPGAYAHTSVALADAVASITAPVIEVHISNIYAREPFRRHSYLSSVSLGCITGLGLNGYRLAVSELISGAGR